MVFSIQFPPATVQKKLMSSTGSAREGANILCQNHRKFGKNRRNASSLRLTFFSEKWTVFKETSITSQIGSNHFVFCLVRPRRELHIAKRLVITRFRPRGDLRRLNLRRSCDKLSFHYFLVSCCSVYNNYCYN